MRSGAVVASAVRELIEPTVRGLGYELVDVQRAAHGLLRVTVDTTSSTRGIGLDDCERISRQLTHLMAVEQIDYERLEVCSPGLDRPLTAPRDFVRFAGSPIQLQLKEPLQGRRRFQGRLRGLESGVESEPQGTLELPLAAIEKAHLVPQFDFRGAGRGAGRAPSGYEKAGSEERRG